MRLKDRLFRFKKQKKFRKPSIDSVLGKVCRKTLMRKLYMKCPVLSHISKVSWLMASNFRVALD